MRGSPIEEPLARILRGQRVAAQHGQSKKQGQARDDHAGDQERIGRSGDAPGPNLEGSRSCLAGACSTNSARRHLAVECSGERVFAVLM